MEGRAAQQITLAALSPFSPPPLHPFSLNCNFTSSCCKNEKIVHKYFHPPHFLSLAGWLVGPNFERSNVGEWWLSLQAVPRSSPNAHLRHQKIAVTTQRHLILPNFQSLQFERCATAGGSKQQIIAKPKHVSWNQTNISLIGTWQREGREKIMLTSCVSPLPSHKNFSRLSSDLASAAGWFSPCEMIATTLPGHQFHQPPTPPTDPFPFSNLSSPFSSLYSQLSHNWTLHPTIRNKTAHQSIILHLPATLYFPVIFCFIHFDCLPHHLGCTLCIARKQVESSKWERMLDKKTTIKACYVTTAVLHKQPNSMYSSSLPPGLAWWYHHPLLKHKQEYSNQNFGNTPTLAQLW